VKRFCQFGAGDEEHLGAGDTPVFECDLNPCITLEGNGLKEIFYFRARGIQNGNSTIPIIGLEGQCGCQVSAVPI
jgi:hypothetical protein